MNKTTIAVLATSVFFALSGPALAQAPSPTKNIFLDFNLGFQPNSQTFAISANPVIYGEVSFFDSSQKFSGSPFLDLTAGYRVWRDLSVGLGLMTTFNKSSASTVSASIPSPIFFDRRVVTNATVSDLEHKERSASLLFMWTSPISDKMDATVMVGPTFIKAFQGLVAHVDVPAGTQSATPIPEVQTATKTGFSFGGDVSYLITPRLGVGGVVRYVAAKVHLTSVPDLKIGGFQIGGGLRVRF